MEPYVIKDAIRALERDIIGAVENSVEGRSAARDADMTGRSHIGAIIAIHDDIPAGADRIQFSAYIEIEDEHQHLYEAEIESVCEQLPGDSKQWRAVSVDVLEANPLPKGG
jgi:hypothetical protein